MFLLASNAEEHARKGIVKGNRAKRWPSFLLSCRRSRSIHPLFLIHVTDRPTKPVVRENRDFLRAKISIRTIERSRQTWPKRTIHTHRPNYPSVHQGQRVGTTSNDTQTRIRCKYVKAKRCFSVESNLILLSSSLLLLHRCISSDIFFFFSTILFVKIVKRAQDTEITSNSKSKYLKTVYILSLPRS